MHSRLVAVAISLVGVSYNVTAETLTFDELPLQPADGAVVAEVRFDYSLDGQPSSKAWYGILPLTSTGEPVAFAGPSGQVLLGHAGGVLGLSFSQPVASLGLDLALNTTETLAAGAVVTFYGEGGATLTNRNLATTPILTYSEGRLDYGGGAFTRAVLSFNRDFTPASAVGPRFVLDNLSFAWAPEGVEPTDTALATPLPSAFWLAGSVLLAVAVVPRRRNDNG